MKISVTMQIIYFLAVIRHIHISALVLKEQYSIFINAFIGFCAEGEMRILLEAAADLHMKIVKAQLYFNILCVFLGGLTKDKSYFSLQNLFIFQIVSNVLLLVCSF